MAQDREARIVVTRGRRSDLKAEVGLYEPATEKFSLLGLAGPGERMIEEYVRKMKIQLERAGNRVSVVER